MCETYSASVQSGFLELVTVPCMPAIITVVLKRAEMAGGISHNHELKKRKKATYKQETSICLVLDMRNLFVIRMPKYQTI